MQFFLICSLAVILAGSPFQLRADEEASILSQEEVVDAEEYGSRLHLFENLGVEENFRTSHPGVFRHVAHMSSFAGTIMLEDGSCWWFKPSIKKLNDWNPTDVIVININQDPASDCRYRLVNITINESKTCKLLINPYVSSEYTRTIKSMHLLKKIVYLDDGSMWDVSLLDQKAFRKWQVNDTIMIGTNNLAFFCWNPNMLINVTKGNYARGGCLSLPKTK